MSVVRRLDGHVAVGSLAARRRVGDGVERKRAQMATNVADYHGKLEEGKRRSP